MLNVSTVAGGRPSRRTVMDLPGGAPEIRKTCRSTLGGGGRGPRATITARKQKSKHATQMQPLNFLDLTDFF